MLHYSPVSAAPGGLVQRPRPAHQHHQHHHQRHRPAAGEQPRGGQPGPHQPGAEHRQPGEKFVRLPAPPDGKTEL